MCYWSTHTHPFTIKFCMYLFLSISIWIIPFGNLFLSETWGFQISLCRNPVSNSRTPKTLLNGNCSETQKINFVVPDYPVIYTGWIKNINFVKLSSGPDHSKMFTWWHRQCLDVLWWMDKSQWGYIFGVSNGLSKLL